nr:Ltp family lipoprotein [Clostridia bacterium]
MFVDSLNAQMAYDPKEALAIVKDGKITYNLLTDSNRNSSAAAPRSYSSGHTPTIGEKNALRSAQSYLKVSAFSRDGLIKQLKYEGYSQREAEYAVDHCGADWYAQAVKSAKTYLELMAFSRSGLIKQLEYEGFTYDQAVYGVTQNGF